MGDAGRMFMWSDYTVEVRLNDYLDIICPHYEEGSVDPRTMERYTLYLVELEEFEACKPSSKEQIRWECNKPSALHGPEKFSEKFQRFTPFTLGKEFKEGHSYYYIYDAAAHVLRSVGQSPAMRGSSPFTFISLLLPLLVPQGL
ncbi:PREDICTED: ephrin-A1 [Chaetura pelagica]|uniref:ephrin-A1 n=1 Tax=Chaetura pelagica TaxID=8897 RepID=UPI0005233186|nr:PREDICTED: ephrin-A1 [Chaetura pelagica]